MADDVLETTGIGDAVVSGTAGDGEVEFDGTDVCVLVFGTFIGIVEFTERDVRVVVEGVIESGCVDDGVIVPEATANGDVELDVCLVVCCSTEGLFVDVVEPGTIAEIVVELIGRGIGVVVPGKTGGDVVASSGPDVDVVLLGITADGVVEAAGTEVSVATFGTTVEGVVEFT